MEPFRSSSRPPKCTSHLGIGLGLSTEKQHGRSGVQISEIESCLDYDFEEIELAQDDLDMLAQVGKDIQFWLANEARNVINLLRSKKLPKVYIHEEADKQAEAGA